MAYLAFHQISKRFPGVAALQEVSFEIEKGSCHALLGENGAGKSTLGKILAGVHTADSGKIILQGTEIFPANPLEARRHGIAMVHQELAFCPNLSVAENLCLGGLPTRGGWLKVDTLQRRAREMLSEIDVDLDVQRPIGQLSTGQEQLVQIAAAIGTEAEIIVMDEPTSSLSAHESENLFRLISHLKQRGITIIYVSHRMEEIFRLCDHATVLRDGRHVVTEPIAQTHPERVIQQMIGRDLVSVTPRHLTIELGEELLRVEKLSSPGKFKEIQLRLCAGEVVGLAGLVGAGRSEVAQAIFGLDPDADGEIFVAGKPLRLHSVQESLRRGIGYLPEDRKRQGLVLSMNCRENITLAALNRISRRGFIRRDEEESLAYNYTARLQVKTPSLETIISALSGGNQQKVALAKWLARDCRVLIVDEPTRGVDVGAKAEIHQLLDELACQGLAVLLISSELPEIMNLSRRIVVLRQGIIQGEVQRADFSQETVMRLMAGLG